MDHSIPGLVVHIQLTSGHVGTRLWMSSMCGLGFVNQLSIAFPLQSHVRGKAG